MLRIQMVEIAFSRTSAADGNVTIGWSHVLVVFRVNDKESTVTRDVEDRHIVPIYCGHVLRAAWVDMLQQAANIRLDPNGALAIHVDTGTRRHLPVDSVHVWRLDPRHKRDECNHRAQLCRVGRRAPCRSCVFHPQQWHRGVPCKTCGVRQRAKTAHGGGNDGEVVRHAHERLARGQHQCPRYAVDATWQEHHRDRHVGEGAFQSRCVVGHAVAPRQVRRLLHVGRSHAGGPREARGAAVEMTQRQRGRWGVDACRRRGQQRGAVGPPHAIAVHGRVQLIGAVAFLLQRRQVAVRVLCHVVPRGSERLLSTVVAGNVVLHCG
eukprot:m.32299 g.32299  ORF g.32299 m.32299 type:complete len:322 (+) comp14099_c0_seq1:845-1810(+)